MGSNMADNHPVGFRWPMKAKERGATLIHVDPRFSRTSAVADLYVPIRPGSDIAFLGGLINYVLTHDKWFKEYVLAYTNASALVSDDYVDAEDNGGLFSGYDPKSSSYDNASWAYAGPAQEAKEDASAHSGHGMEGTSPAKHRPARDETLQHPSSVFQILKRHYARYTPEMVERVCGTPPSLFLQVAEVLTRNSGRERTSAICYAVGWTQQSYGAQIIRAAGILQLLLGNIGRPGGGIMALRGHASIQGSTDVPTLFDLLPGYLPHPAAFKGDDTLERYMRESAVRGGYWSNLPKFMVSLLKAWYGDAATSENEFGYQWIPKLTGHHSYVYHLGRRLKDLYRGSTNPRDQGLLNLTWDYLPERPDPEWRIKDEPSDEKVLMEVNGYTVAERKQVPDFEQLKADGSTACGVWIYSGVFPGPAKNMARRRSRTPDNDVEPEWGFAWPGNRRILYNRASADPAGRPWSERKKYVWWDAAAGKWTGKDIPDFPVKKAPGTPAKQRGSGIDLHSGSDPFTLKADGRGWLFAPSGLKDGPLPTHYEPLESPVLNALYERQDSPVAKRFSRKDNAISPPGDPRYPYIVTTYRVTEQYTSGVMSRWNGWLSELMPEMFAEISPELAAEKGIANLDWITVSTPRNQIECKALVTRRIRPCRHDGGVIHEIGLPYHWGYKGLVTGAMANDLVPLSEEPNVYIQEDKAFTCNIRKGRLR